MIVQSELNTVKNLQHMFEMTDIVILCDDNLHLTRWVGFIKDLPLSYLHGIIVNMFVCDVNITDKSLITVYFR